MHGAIRLLYLINKTVSGCTDSSLVKANNFDISEVGIDNTIFRNNRMLHLG